MPRNPRESTADAAITEACIAFGEVRHARTRPTAHAFRYPAYFLRLPMRNLDEALRHRRLLSRNSFNLMAFHDADHGDPTDVANAVDHGRLVRWIDALLRNEGIVDAGGEMWLHTFPRVLGYSFKPVSFWFCHRSDGALRAIVCEINNTFRERHCYLLAHDDGHAIANGEELCATKVFHVSPFCEVAGRYRFRFLHRSDRTIARIDYDDADGPLIATSLSGALRPLSDRALLAAFVRSPLFSFGVIARIHWQALRLWLLRTPLFPKPTSASSEVSR